MEFIEPNLLISARIKQMTGNFMKREKNILYLPLDSEKSEKAYPHSQQKKMSSILMLPNY